MERVRCGLGERLGIINWLLREGGSIGWRGGGGIGGRLGKERFILGGNGWSCSVGC